MSSGWVVIWLQPEKVQGGSPGNVGNAIMKSAHHFSYQWQETRETTGGNKQVAGGLLL